MKCICRAQERFIRSGKYFMKKIIYIIAAIVLITAGYYLYIYWALGNDSTKEPVVVESVATSSQEVVGENPEGEAEPSRMSLTMTTWKWQRALYNDGREILPNRQESFTLKFNSNGTFSTTTDCNSAAGKYVAAGGVLTFTDIASTLMYCEGSQEAEFIQLLNNTSAYHFTSHGELILDLKFDSGSVVFR